MTTEHKGHYLVDLDGTLALYDTWKGVEHIGEPVKAMLDRVKKWLDEGKDVRIMTARACPVDAPVGSLPDPKSFATMTAEEIGAWQAVAFIREWCTKHLGRELHVTCRKDFATIEIWDDRAVGVMRNRGVPGETVVAYHLHRVLESAGMKVADNTEYAVAADKASSRIRAITQGAEDAYAYLDGARDALEFVKLDKLDDATAGDIRRARTAIVKALQPLLRARGL